MEKLPYSGHTDEVEGEELIEGEEMVNWYGRQCKHWRQSVPVGNGFVTLSAYYDRDRGKELINKDGIDLGIYFDVAWERMLTPITAVNFKIRGIYSAMFLHWVDRSDIELRTLRRAINIVSKFLDQNKTVDIGCLGAHGRSGTFLTCLIAKQEGLDAKTAIKEAKRRYCSKIIESNKQTALIYKYCFEKVPKEINKEVQNVTRDFLKEGKPFRSNYSVIHGDD